MTQEALFCSSKGQPPTGSNEPTHHKSRWTDWRWRRHSTKSNPLLHRALSIIRQNCSYSIDPRGAPKIHHSDGHPRAKSVNRSITHEWRDMNSNEAHAKGEIPRIGRGDGESSYSLLTLHLNYFINMIKHFWSTGELSHNFRSRVMKVIPKKLDKRHLRHWRPLTMLTVYKLIASILLERISPVNKVLISPQQTGFIPGRSIMENISLGVDDCRMGDKEA